MFYSTALESHYHSHLKKYTHQNSNLIIQICLKMTEDCQLIFCSSKYQDLDSWNNKWQCFLKIYSYFVFKYQAKCNFQAYQKNIHCLHLPINNFPTDNLWVTLFLLSLKIHLLPCLLFSPSKVSHQSRLRFFKNDVSVIPRRHDSSGGQP